MTSVDTAAKRRLLVEWLNSLFPSLNISLEASEEELRAHLFDGIVLCGIVNRQDPAFLENQRGAFMSSEQRQEKVRRFLLTVERMGLPSFTVADLENGPTSAVVDCLLSLRNLFNCKPDEGEVHKTANYRYQALKKWVNSKDDGEAMDASHRNVIQSGQSPPLGEENNNNRSASRFSPVFGSPIFPEKTVSLSNAGRKPNELQLKHGLQYTDTSTTKVFEMIKSNGLVNAPVQSLLTVIHGILNESINRKNREIPLLAASLLRKVMHEIERRILTQEEHIRNQNDLIKAPEERHQSRIKEFETMASGTNEETQVQKTAIRESKKNEQQNALQLLKENERNHKMILELKQELEINNMYEHHNQQFDAEAKQDEAKLQERIKEVEFLLFESSKRMNELEALLQSNLHKWNKKDYVLPKFNTFQSSLKKLKTLSESIRVEVINSQRIWSEEMISMGDRLKMFVDAAENYHTVLTENTKLYNEVQELKGNIRVYCRIRPFLPGQMTKLKAVDFSGNNGELVLVNSSRQGKDGHRVFKFNKVFGQTATQVQVFLDIQPLVRSVLDGYNVCIFAYGQTGSGKTYTMSGPDLPSEEEQGVNYRALNDLFHISQERKNAYTYEVGVQMVEIYNEQIRDLLSNNVSQKRLVIFNSSQPHGLVVPDAIMVPVKSSADVLALMEFGQANRAVGSTALNERSSRSHSILTVHVRGVDLKTQSTLRGCLHLIDLAGSERVDRSEVTGDRLKEAQHINKSLSALGDVIFALSQKSAHVPYRNSKLTQILQSSLGGHAKTLMFVHINPDGESYPETLSTLKFAERVSGVELGAARISKEGKDVKDLIEQVASLKDIIARKDDEIEKLQMLKCPSIKSSKSYSLRRFSSSDGISSSGGVTQKGDVKIVKICEKDIPDAERFSDSSIQNSDVGSQLSMFYEGNARNCIFDGGNANKGQHIDDETGEVESDRRLSAVSYSYHSHGEAEYIQDSTIESEVHPESELRPQMCK